MTAEHGSTPRVQKSVTCIWIGGLGHPSKAPLPGSVGRALVAGVVGLLLAVVPATVWAAPPEAIQVQKVAQAPVPPEWVRLHIIAHSDSPEDQRLKLRVRDALLDRYGEELWALTDEPSVLAWAAARREAVETLAREVAKLEGAAYGARLVAGWAHFPETRLDNRLYPAGQYLAVRLILGEGAGQNWWCVLFPPLCLVDEAQVTELEARPADAVVPVWVPAGGEPPAGLPLGLEWRSYLLDGPAGKEGSWPLRWAEAQQLVAGAARLVSPPVHAHGEEEAGYVPVP